MAFEGLQKGVLQVVHSGFVIPSTCITIESYRYTLISMSNEKLNKIEDIYYIVQQWLNDDLNLQILKLLY